MCVYVKTANSCNRVFKFGSRGLYSCHTVYCIIPLLYSQASLGVQPPESFHRENYMNQRHKGACFLLCSQPIAFLCKNSQLQQGGFLKRSVTAVNWALNFITSDSQYRVFPTDSHSLRVCSGFVGGDSHCIAQDSCLFHIPQRASC